MTPAKPVRFDPETPPPGFELKLLPFWQERRIITPRLQLVHTNGASGEGSIQSSYNWAMHNSWPNHIHGTPPGPQYTTIPTCQIDRDGHGALMLPSNRQPIANAKANSFSLGFETADRGYNTDPYPTGSFFTDEQAEAVAVACAYYAWGHNIPLAYPKTWDGSGTACHTEPFTYPYWTSSKGKPCPGDRKKHQVRNVILPRAQEIVDAWTKPPPPPPPPPEDEVTDDDLVKIGAAIAAAAAANVDATAEAAADLVWSKMMTFKPTNKSMSAQALLETAAHYAANADMNTRPPTT